MRSNFYFLKKQLLASACLLVLTAAVLPAQKPAKPTAADIFQSVKKLNVLGSVLYVAAHPDDENQRFISYMANEKLYNVTYLSLTRGDGGQNLIGPELRELLGVLRTEELLMARSLDGGKQQFSRANDFGFSKNPEETMRIWNKDEVLADVVWQFRQTRPDVVVNRFYHDKKYDTHGHHTASGMLSVEAFGLSARPDAYPEQLKFTETWQPRRIFFNTSWFFFGGRDKFEAMDKSHLFSLDLGVFLPLKGKSNNELASEARSMHRCQGFGSMSTRGENMEYFDFIQGDRPATNDLFEGINTTWSRVEGGEAVGKILVGVERDFRFDNPAASIPELLKAMKKIKALPDGFWKRTKLAEIKEVIRQCMGLYIEASAAEPAVTPGEKMKIKLECLNRSRVPATLAAVTVAPGLFDTVFAKNLDFNKNFIFEKTVQFADNVSFTAPYWLLQPYSTGMYTVPEQRMRGVPETPRVARVRWSFVFDGEPLEFETDVIFKKEEPALGEVYQPFEVLPPLSVAFKEQAYLFNESSKDVTLVVRAGRDNFSGKIALQTPLGWVCRTEPVEINLKRKGEEKTLVFNVLAAGGESSGMLRAVVETGGQQLTPYTLFTVKYDHIPQQTVLLPAEAKAARLDVRTTAKNIGYYMGAGDEVPAALRQIGCSVTLLEDKDMEPSVLQKFDAIVLGIRAFNTKDNLKFQYPALLRYAENGGTLVLQYNNSFDLAVEQIGPFPLKIGRSRVTDEAAEMRFLQPEHAVLNAPNKITPADFEGWVQERGLYFPSEWDVAYAAPLSCNDPGEKPADGAVLVAQHGKGWFVYSSLSFFRELPAGVPGAMRLFANLISLGRRV